MNYLKRLMNMKKTIKFKYNLLAGPVLLFIQALLFFAAGIYCVANNEKNLDILCKVLGVFIAIAGAVSVLSYMFIRKNRMLSTLLSGIAYLFLGAMLWLNADFMLKSVVYLVGVWMLINFLWRLLLCFLLKSDGANGFYRAVVDCAISLAFALLVFVLPQESTRVIFIIVGIYLVMYGFTVLGDAIREILKWDLSGKKIKRKIRFRLPVFFTAFLPLKVFNEINKNLNEVEQPYIEVVKEEMKDYTPRVEVFIHTSPKIAMGFGHMDIALNGIVYSYGMYDIHSKRYFELVSDGVFLEMPEEKYVNHCLSVDNENIVMYSLYFPQEQIENMERYVKEFKKNVRGWKCRKQADPEGEYDDPASVFYSKADAQLYKFHSGKYKSYFALKTNCVQFADDLLCSSGISTVSMNGIITPGTYYRYLENNFHRQNSFVVRKTILAGAEELETTKNKHKYSKTS